MVSSLLLISSSSLTASAEVALPDGAVKGLPEKLTAMDSEGAVVDSATGEYFFHVENMQYGDRYYASEECSDWLEEAYESIDSALDTLGNI